MKTVKKFNSFKELKSSEKLKSNELSTKHHSDFENLIIEIKKVRDQSKISKSK